MNCYITVTISPETANSLRLVPCFFKVSLNFGSSHFGSAEMNLTSIHEDAGSVSASLSGLWNGVLVTCGVGRRCTSDLALE